MLTASAKPPPSPPPRRHHSRRATAAFPATTAVAAVACAALAAATLAGCASKPVPAPDASADSEDFPVSSSANSATAPTPAPPAMLAAPRAAGTRATGNPLPPLGDSVPALSAPVSIAGSPPALLAKPPPPPLSRAGHPVLEKLLLHATTRSAAMLEQENQIAQNDPFRWRGWRQYMPYVNAGYQAGEFKIFKSRYQQGSQMLNATYYLALRYPLFTWFAESAEKNADLLREKRAQHNASIAWLHLANGIRREFFNAVILKNQIALKEKQIALEKQHQGRLDENLAAGVSAETNRLSQSVALREKQFDHDGAKVRLADLVTRLRTLSGLETFTEADIPSSVPSPEVDCAVLERRLAAYAQAVAAGETASARVARIEREILDDEITQVRARKLPTFNLGATISQNPYDAGGNRGYEMRNILFFGISGNWNLFDRDITNTTIRSIQTRQRLIDARLSSEKINRENSLRNLIGQIRSAQELLAIRREYEKNAAQHLAGLRESLRLGLYTELDVETAEARLDNLRLGIAENQTAIVRDFYEFLAGIGQDPAAYYYTAPNNE